MNAAGYGKQPASHLTFYAFSSKMFRADAKWYFYSKKEDRI